VLTVKSIDSVITKLIDDNDRVKTTLDNFIKVGINFIEHTDELLEEILDYDELYQFYITDINFNFWIKISKGKITYKNGISNDASIKIYMTKDLILKILKREIGGTEAYMKGLVKLSGNLTHGFKIKTFLRHLINYFELYSKKRD
jgi:hypothetical protein